MLEPLNLRRRILALEQQMDRSDHLLRQRLRALHQALGERVRTVAVIGGVYLAVAALAAVLRSPPGRMKPDHAATTTTAATASTAADADRRRPTPAAPAPWQRLLRAASVAAPMVFTGLLIPLASVWLQQGRLSRSALWGVIQRAARAALLPRVLRFLTRSKSR